MESLQGDDAMKQVLYIHRLMENCVGRKLTMSSLHPLWYRGLSNAQMNAAKAMSEALTYDMMQETTHRVYRQLGYMGVAPRPPECKLPLLYRMSRGNDVAFLWFLMEMFYKSNTPSGIYGYNEQIIMSAIFLLDLHPTLYELDRVLPLPHESAEVRERQAKADERRRKLIEEEARLAAKKKQKKPEKIPPHTGVHPVHYKLPYFQVPVPFKPRRSKLLASYPKRIISLKELPPEPPPQSSPLWTRWFGNFSLNEGKCVVISMLNKELKAIFASLKAAKLNTNHVETMCEHHNQIKAIELSLHCKLEMIKQEKLEKLLDIGRRHRQRNRQRVLAELERLSKFYEEKFHNMAVHTRLASNRKRLCLDINEPDFIYVHNDDSDKDELCEANPQTKQSLRKLLEANKRLTCSCCGNGQNQVKLPSEAIADRPSRLMHFLQQGGTEAEQTSTQTPTRSSCHLCRKSSQYFELGREAYNYRYNYRKLFQPSNDKLVDNQQLRLKAEFIKALDGDVEYLNAILNGDENHTLDELVQRVVKKCFTMGIEIFEEYYTKLKQKTNAKKRLDFGQDYFDANDMGLMKEMLRLGLEHVAKDHRYVLPTLPDVHLVPLLVDWIRARYGKRYNQVDSQLSFYRAKFLMEHLAIIMSHYVVQFPFFSGNISKNNTVQLKNELKKLKMRYINHFILGIMELGRAFNFAMKANEDHNMYNSYMPAHIRDVQFSATRHLGYRTNRKKN